MRIQLHQYLLSGGRIRQAMVNRQKQEYQRQSGDVNNTRQGSRSQVQRSKVGQSGVTHRDNRYGEERSEM